MLESILGAFIIMVMRICDVSIGTMRTILVVQGRKYFAGLAGMIEVSDLGFCNTIYFSKPRLNSKSFWICNRIWYWKHIRNYHRAKNWVGICTT